MLRGIGALQQSEALKNLFIGVKNYQFEYRCRGDNQSSELKKKSDFAADSG